MDLQQKIMELADAQQDALTARRRDLHEHPEPGWTEFRTAALAASVLSRLGYTVTTGTEAMDGAARMGVPSAAALAAAHERALLEGAEAGWLDKMTGGYTGVVGTMQFSADGPVVALRFDMDCNDVEEASDPGHRPHAAGFRSLHARAMHACGHDGHTAVGLATAGLLAQLKNELRGTIKLIFQPAEEGVRGARAMVERGIVDDVDYMLGAHFGFKMRHTGSIACNVTGFLATSKFDARFIGLPAHAGAAPEAGKNALLAAACAALNLHAIPRHSAGVSRINVGYLEAGSGRNVIGDKALMRLETRGGSSEINAYMETEAIRILRAAAAMYDVQLDITQMGGAAGGSNSPELAAYLERHAKQLGIFQEVIGACDFGASEDFSYFMERVQQHGGQAAYMMIGADLAAGHHDSHFDFDEKALVYALKMLTTTAASLLLEKKL